MSDEIKAVTEEELDKMSIKDCKAAIYDQNLALRICKQGIVQMEGVLAIKVKKYRAEKAEDRRLEKLKEEAGK